MRKELRQRLAGEYRYAVTKMQEAKQPTQKLFYFSVLFGEAQRVLNWEWDTDLALVYIVTHYTHTQINAALAPPAMQTFPTDWKIIFDKLPQVASDLATYYEQDKDDKGELCRILGLFSEIAFAVFGNGSYLHEKGAFKL